MNFRLRIAAAVAVASLLPCELTAQRERLIVRTEGFGATPVTVPAGSAMANEHTQQGVQLTLAHRLVRQQGSTGFVNSPAAF